MNCPVCNAKTKIINTRTNKSNNIARTRKCINCDIRIHTKETINATDIAESYKKQIVRKQDERREVNE